MYFNPPAINGEHPANTIGHFINQNNNNKNGNLSNIDIAIIGVQEDRNTFNNNGCADAPDAVRKYLYPLYSGSYSIKIADLGNIKPGHSAEDTYFALGEVVAELIQQKITPIIIGGGNELAYANYLAYQKLSQVVNLAAVDARFDIGDNELPLSSCTWLSKIILSQPNCLFNYSNIGYQTYYASQQEITLMDKLYFDVHRLGQMRANTEDIEPIVRNADMLSFDISAVRQSDAPGNNNPNPNGFFGEEACQIMRYAGMSDKLTSLGIYEINPHLDNGGQTASLAGQMIWYFIDGFYNRKNDYPVADKSEYLKYRVVLKDNQNEIVFYKSNRSERWWMDVPYPMNNRLKFERHHLVPCSYADYQTACNDEMPDKWWKTYQKLC